jgi:hypothetical protein
MSKELLDRLLAAGDITKETYEREVKISDVPPPYKEEIIIFEVTADAGWKIKDKLFAALEEKGINCDEFREIKSYENLYYHVAKPLQTYYSKIGYVCNHMRGNIHKFKLQFVLHPHIPRYYHKEGKYTHTVPSVINIDPKKSEDTMFRFMFSHAQ